MGRLHKFILAGAALLALRASRFQPFGLLDDDARHWLAAQSFLQGRYADLSAPGEPPLTTLLPGYPLILLPAALLGSIGLAQLMNAAFLGGAGWLLLRRFKTEGGAAPWLVALTVFNPLSIVQGATVMSDAPFLFFTLLAMGRIDGLHTGPHDARRAALAGLLAGFCCWIRPHGAALVLAGAAVLALGPRTRRAAGVFLAAAGTFAALPFLRNLLVAGSAAGYLAEIPGTQDPEQRFAQFMANAASNLLWLPVGGGAEALAGWVEPWPWGGGVLGVVIGLAACALVTIGLKKGLSARPERRLEAVYCAVYLFLFLFWVNRFHRYLFPLLPFLYIACWSALRARTKVAAALAGVTLAVFAWSDRALATGSSRIMEGRLPSETFVWLGRSVPPDGVLAVMSRSQMFRHHTGRKAVPLLSGADPDRWFAGLLEAGATHAVAHEWGGLEHYAPSRRVEFAPALEAAESRLRDPARFRPVFKEEGWRVYEILRPAGFAEGWALMLEAQAALEAGDLPAGLALLKRAEKTRAPLVRLPFYLGTTEMLLGHKAEARRYLEEAARREPGFEAVRINLGRLDGSIR